MNAIESIQPRQPTPKRRRQQRLSFSSQVMAMEIGVKFLVNGVLCTVALAAMVKLLPYYFSQREKLQEVHNQVIDTEKRVGELRQNFTRNFDPTQTKAIMQKYSSQSDPNQRRIFWKEIKP